MSQEWGDPAAVSSEVEYNATHQVVQEVDGRGTITQHTYDPLGRRVATVEALDQPEERWTDMTYDVMDNMTSITTGQAPTNPNYDKPFQVRYQYDALNRRITETRGTQLSYQE